MSGSESRENIVPPTSNRDRPVRSRRSFLKDSAATAGAAGVLGAVGAGEEIRVGLVGCGGRGTGAAAQALQADDYAVLTAVADIDQERVDRCLQAVEERHAGKKKVLVTKQRQFLGLNAYQKVVDSGVDVVLLATPPGFRPQHLRACIDAGKHVFCEKPVAVDAPGARSVYETVKMAEAKKLSIVSGLCWRYNTKIVAAMEQVHAGAIGDVVSYYATFYTNPVKPMPPHYERPLGMSDVEWQIRNWYNFVWTCGDGLVEQAVHSADKIAWAMGDRPPESCVAVGGRQVPAHDGNIFDHFEINYLYPNGTRAFLGCRQITGCYRENADYILGTKGRLTIGRGLMPRIEGENRWVYRGPQNNMYQEEHDVLFRAIRRGEPVNDGARMTDSTMLALLGRMAAYTGQQLTWEQAMESKEKRFPDNLLWNMPHDVPPLARPGHTKFV